MAANNERSAQPLVPFATVAGAWEQFLVESMVKRGEDGSTLLALHPADYVSGDLQATEVAMRSNRRYDAFAVSPEDVALELRINVLNRDARAQPPPLWIMPEALLGEAEADGRLGLVIGVSTDLVREVVVLEGLTNLVIDDAEERVLQGDSNDMAPFARIRDMVTRAGATIVTTRTASGVRRFRIVRELDRRDLTFTVVMAIPSTYDQALEQVTEFARLAGTVNRALIAGYQAMGESSSFAKEKAGGCYIATAVYGSHEAPEVLALRRFRDERLAGSAIGRVAIQLYYRVSPRLASCFRGDSPLSRGTRRILNALVKSLGYN